MELDWTVRFEDQVLDGIAMYTLRRAPTSSTPLRLDTRDLEIIEAKAGRAGTQLEKAVWHLGDPDPVLGRELTVDLPDGADRVMVHYRTNPGATGLQWLTKEQTSGGKLPFLYTQSQAIHARSWIPCQDSPGVRVTYDATVRVPQPLRAVMAAKEVSAGEGIYKYRMEHPIPSYLIALAVGDLAFGTIGPRTGVWAEPAVVERALHEFSDLEKMLTAAETRYGPYRWGRYDLLVLPPSFPFGGMENPMLTFATPTILAGDRSLVALIAHELAHSWSGNLVTNATWSDFWLNEGFTTYVERRIMEDVYGTERAQMEWKLGRQDLDAEIAETLKDRPGDQILQVDVKGRDPDDAFSDIPYEKGAAFLLLVERLWGRDVFDPFLKAWFDEHAFKSVTTADFLAFMEERIAAAPQGSEGLKVPDTQVWLTAPGLPKDAPRTTSDQLATVDALAASWLAGKTEAAALPTRDWTTHHWQHFLRGLPPDLGRDRMAELDAAFSLTKAGNSEVLHEWLVLSVRHGYAPAYARLSEFLTGMGRRKFLTPLYRELMKTDQGKAMASQIYTEARPMYHVISRRTLDPIVGWPPQAAGDAATRGASQ
jgi:aminopeptidase N